MIRPLVVGLVVASAAAAGSEPPNLRFEVVAEYAHDPTSFTQGLLYEDGSIIESTGGHGTSWLRRWELESGRVERETRLSAELFGEGLAAEGDRFVQLTWQSGLALIHDRNDLSTRGEFRYRGEGWGLCFDGRHFVMSDGSSQLVFRSAETFAPVGALVVTRAGRAQAWLNELEWVDGAIWANVWQTDEIVRIDPTRGVVTGVLSLAGLLTPAERASADVLNGIAYRRDRGTLLVTGKLWPKIFEIRIEEEPGQGRGDR